MLRHALGLALICFSAVAQERTDSGINDSIRREATENSRVLRTIHYITDVFGARITGSPQLQAAGEWAARQLTDWGAQNSNLEPWNFGRDGWSNERVAAFLVTPVKDTLVAETLAWTPGTNGAVTASCVQIVPPDGPTAPTPARTACPSRPHPGAPSPR